MSTITLKQVAERAGVSYQTVWRAIHGNPGILPATRDQVLAVATALGYRRNHLAGSLRTNQSRTLGLVVLDVSNPFTGEVTSGIEAAARTRGYTVLLMNSHDDVGREREAVISLMERRVDGLIISPARGGDQAYLGEELPSGFPVIAVNRPTRGYASPSVESRHSDVAEAARHLVSLGYDKLGGIFGPFENEPFLHRWQAYRATIRHLGRPTRKAWVQTGENSAAFARAAVRAMLSSRERPDALFAASHRLTEGALLALRDLGLHQGRDIGLVGFDSRYGSMLSPAMPVLMQSGTGIGRLAAEALLRLIQGGILPDLAPLPITLRLDHAD